MEKDFDLGVDNEKREILDGIAKYSANPWLQHHHIVFFIFSYCVTHQLPLNLSMLEYYDQNLFFLNIIMINGHESQKINILYLIKKILKNIYYFIFLSRKLRL